MDKQSNNKKQLEQISLLSKELMFARKKIKELDGENSNLETEITSLKNNFNKLLAENTVKQQNRLSKRENEALKERAEKSSKEEWEKIIDEMAHSINSDVYVAVSYLSKIPSNTFVNIALSHTKQIRDLITLIMQYLKRKDIEFFGEVTEIPVKEFVEGQINTIKNSLTTLRLSVDEHQKLLEEIIIPIEVNGNINITIAKELKDAVTLILKDLLRNAFKNTDEDNPQISIKIDGKENFVELIIINNKPISDDFANWFNGITDEEPQISKSSKVGLRVILKWTKLLGIKVNLKADKLENKTTAKLIFPREIKYEN